MQYFGADGLGSVRQIYNSAGIVQMNGRYDPFGNVMNANGNATSVYGFTGEQTDATGLVYLRARYMDPTQGRFTTRDIWKGSLFYPTILNQWVYVTNNPVRLIDPSGFQGEEKDFRVRPEDGGPWTERIDKMNRFKSKHWNLPSTIDPWDALGRETTFVNWLIASNRLSNDKIGNWYDVSDQYLMGSRFVGERLAEYIKQQVLCNQAVPLVGGLDPGVAEWAALVLVADGIQSPALVSAYMPAPIFQLVSTGTINSLSWLAHNTALREGVRRADTQGLRKQEPYYEQALINFVLYDVLEPGDQCARLKEVFCLSALPIALHIGLTYIYPNHYPATREDIIWIGASFSGIYSEWAQHGGYAPDANIHLIDETVPGPQDVWPWILTKPFRKKE